MGKSTDLVSKSDNYDAPVHAQHPEAANAHATVHSNATEGGVKVYERPSSSTNVLKSLPVLLLLILVSLVIIALIIFAFIP